MKNMNLLKCCTIALVGCAYTSASAQVKKPVFTEIPTPVVVEGGMESMPFIYEAAAAWGDYDNDGLLDLIVSGATSEGEKTLLYKNKGEAKFVKVEHSFPGLRTANATWFDYNNDGNLDLFLAGAKNSDGVMYSGLWRNKGGDAGFEEVFVGTFPLINNGSNNRSNRYVVAADYDGDGWADLYIQGRTNGGDKNAGLSCLYKNVNGERFTRVDKPVKNKMGSSEAKPLVQLSGGGAAWGDYDGDGFLDIIASGEGIDADKYDKDYGYHGGYNGAVYKNNGDGTFAEPVEFEGSEEGNATWIDYNNDGKLDFASPGVRWDEDLSWNWRGDMYINSVKGFTKYNAASTGLPGGKQALSMDAGDANNDGFSDILYMNAAENDVLYLNNGGVVASPPMFTASPLIYQGGGKAQRGGTATLVDFDNDGNLDAFLAGYGDVAGSHARLMKNNLGGGIVSNKAPGAPTNLRVTSGTNGIAMFSWDAPADDTTPTAALRYNLYIKQGDVVRMTIPADVATGRLKTSEVSGLISKRILYKVSGLTGDYTWGVQAIDQAKAASPFSMFGSASGIADQSMKASVKMVGEKEAIRILAAQDSKGVVSVYSMDGGNVYSESVQLNNVVIRLPKGVYLVNVTSASGIVTEKVVVR